VIGWIVGGLGLLFLMIAGVTAVVVAARRRGP
jgi:hypothetical protein